MSGIEGCYYEGDWGFQDPPTSSEVINNLYKSLGANLSEREKEFNVYKEFFEAVNSIELRVYSDMTFTQLTRSAYKKAINKLVELQNE